MDSPVSAATANRAFSRLLREVREQGRTFVVTAHGKPVARIVPARAQDAGREQARAALRERLIRQATGDAGAWSRDELYRRAGDTP